ncbi:MAG: hypothetical protein ACI9WU_004495 [Myxococcota bacterium]|jgi:hypothetical protein
MERLWLGLWAVYVRQPKIGRRHYLPVRLRRAV